MILKGHIENLGLLASVSHETVKYLIRLWDIPNYFSRCFCLKTLAHSISLTPCHTPKPQFFGPTTGLRKFTAAFQLAVKKYGLKHSSFKTCIDHRVPKSQLIRH